MCLVINYLSDNLQVAMLEVYKRCRLAINLSIGENGGNGFRFYYYKLFAKNDDSSRGKLTFKDYPATFN